MVSLERMMGKMRLVSLQNYYTEFSQNFGTVIYRRIRPYRFYISSAQNVPHVFKNKHRP